MSGLCAPGCWSSLGSIGPRQIASCWNGVATSGGMGNALNNLGFVAKHLGELDEAERLQREGLACMRKADAEKDVARLLKDFSATLIWNGKFDEAMQKVEESRRIYENLGVAENYYQIMISIALLLLDQGEIEQAIELYALAGRYAYIRNSRRFQDLAGEELEREAARLGKERLKELKARSQAQDLWQTAERLQATFPDWAAKSYQTPRDLNKDE
jgi:tetratricopeptide (TPR) repeat protein